MAVPARHGVPPIQSPKREEATTAGRLSFLSFGLSILEFGRPSFVRAPPPAGSAPFIPKRTKRSGLHRTWIHCAHARRGRQSSDAATLRRLVRQTGAGRRYFFFLAGAAAGAECAGAGAACIAGGGPPAGCIPPPAAGPPAGCMPPPAGAPG